jgi:hypothetical protein
LKSLQTQASSLQIFTSQIVVAHASSSQKKGIFFKDAVILFASQIALLIPHSMAQITAFIAVRTQTGILMNAVSMLYQRFAKIILTLIQNCSKFAIMSFMKAYHHLMITLYA